MLHFVVHNHGFVACRAANTTIRSASKATLLGVYRYIRSYCDFHAAFAFDKHSRGDQARLDSALHLQMAALRVYLKIIFCFHRSLTSLWQLQGQEGVRWLAEYLLLSIDDETCFTVGRA
jgi:hypothetical protein